MIIGVPLDIYRLAKTPGSHRQKAAPSGHNGSAIMRFKSQDEIVWDLHQLVNGIVKRSEGTYRLTKVVMALEAYNHVATRCMGDGSRQTILSFFLATTPYVTDVRAAWRLDAQHSANWLAKPEDAAACLVIAYSDPCELLPDGNLPGAAVAVMSGWVD